MPDKRTKLIINPNANLGRTRRAAEDLLPVMEEYGEVDWVETAYPTHAVELARQAAEEGYDLVITGGGDGTLHEVVNGLMQAPREGRPRLGIVPLGSGNDFSFALGLDSHPINALRAVFTGQPRSVDIGRVRNEHGREVYWINMLGIGFDAMANIRAHRLPLPRGHLIYLLAVIQTILVDHDAADLSIETDEEAWQGEMQLLTLCNGSREGGGFLVVPEARPDDGKFNYAGINRLTRLMMFRLLPEVLRGTHGRFQQVRMGQFRRLSLQADRPLSVQADGEILAIDDDNVRQLEVELMPGELEVQQ